MRLRFLARNRLGLLVVDDGIAGPTAAAPSEPLHSSALRSLIERAELARGHVQVRRRPGIGLVVRAIL